jgi:hypothetical protein
MIGCWLRNDWATLEVGAAERRCWLAGLAAAQVSEHGEHAPVVAAGVGQSEFEEY